jgi:hypothetical protein
MPNTRRYTYASSMPARRHAGRLDLAGAAGPERLGHTQFRCGRQRASPPAFHGQQRGSACRRNGRTGPHPLAAPAPGRAGWSASTGYRGMMLPPAPARLIFSSQCVQGFPARSEQSVTTHSSITRCRRRCCLGGLALIGHQTVRSSEGISWACGNGATCKFCCPTGRLRTLPRDRLIADTACAALPRRSAGVQRCPTAVYCLLMRSEFNTTQRHTPGHIQKSNANARYACLPR